MKFIASNFSNLLCCYVQHISPKWWPISTKIHGVISQKPDIFIFMFVRTWTLPSSFIPFRISFFIYYFLFSLLPSFFNSSTLLAIFLLYFLFSTNSLMTEKQNGAAWQNCLARDVTVWSFKQLFLFQLHNNAHTHPPTHTYTDTHTCHHARLAEKHTCVSERLIIFKVKQRESSLCTSPLNYKKLGQIKKSVTDCHLHDQCVNEKN